MQSLSATELDRAAALLLNGGLVAFPTETVYGLGADASNASAVSRSGLSRIRDAAGQRVE
ncbi:MAG: Telomere recombination [Pseudomonadota bacterium]